MRIVDSKENVVEIKKCMHPTFSGRHIFLKPLYRCFVCVCVCSGGVGVLKRVGGGGHIKMITHRKTAAFMVFLYFLKVFL